MLYYMLYLMKSLSENIYLKNPQGSFSWLDFADLSSNLASAQSAQSPCWNRWNFAWRCAWIAGSTWSSVFPDQDGGTVLVLECYSFGETSSCDSLRFAEATCSMRSWDMLRYTVLFWLVVSTRLKNISQLGWLSPIYGKIKNVRNHQPLLGCLGMYWISIYQCY